jgi:hypothetical protein
MFSDYDPNEERNASQKGGCQRFNDQSVDCAIVLDCEKTFGYFEQKSADLFVSGSKPVVRIGATIPRSVFHVFRCYPPVPVSVGSCGSASGAIAHPKPDSERLGKTGRLEKSQSVTELFSSDRTNAFWRANLAACKVCCFRRGW